jgi:hypothetical protein
LSSNIKGKKVVPILCFVAKCKTKTCTFIFHKKKRHGSFGMKL